MSKHNKQFNLDIMPHDNLLKHHIRQAKVAGKPPEFIELLNTLRNIAKRAKKDAKDKHPSGEFLYSENISSALAALLPDKIKREFKKKGLTFVELDNDNTQVTMTFKVQSWTKTHPTGFPVGWCFIFFLFLCIFCYFS